MKRPTIIALGILIILLILGMWVYLLLYGAPKQAQDVFTNLGIGNSQQEVRVVDTQNTSTDTKLALGGSALQQLTTRALAGFGFASSSPTTIVYAERGTGYIYQIDTLKGAEEQISVTTIAQTAQAVFSPNANAVAITTYAGYNKDVSVGIIKSGDSAVKFEKLPINAENLSFINDTTLYFTVEKEATTIAYGHNLKTHTDTMLFSIPFTGVKTLWGSDLTKIYVQTKPSQYLEGYVYNVSKGTLTPLPQTGFGLSMLPSNTSVIASRVEDGLYTSYASGNGTTTRQPIAMFSEKCVFDTAQSTWCAAPLTPTKASYLEDWYKGAITSEDYLWHTTLKAQSATLIGDLPKLAGRTLDVLNLKINKTGSLLLFSNKTDQTLWMYSIKQ